jgi:hypothetical protein
MNKIEDIINTNYWELKKARAPKNTGQMLAPPPDEPWTTGEVLGLINSIKQDVNSELARRYLEE